MKKTRLDILLLEKGLASSRQKARALIMAGKVLVNGMRVDKPGKELSDQARVSVEEELPYVGRGGLKLRAALEGFGINPRGLIILDAGASTGGFTDCLLDRGAAHVIAVDVGYGQFDWGLRNDPRVTLMERTNVRFLDPATLKHPVHGVVADLSFISLRVVLRKFHEILAAAGWVVPLIKPQFEVGKGEVGKGGVIRDYGKVRAAVDGVKEFAAAAGFVVLGELESPVRGQKGNREFFLYLRKREHEVT